MSMFRWYRKLRGGRWARVTGYLWGTRWVRLPIEALDCHEEDWGTQKGSKMSAKALRRSL